MIWKQTWWTFAGVGVHVNGRLHINTSADGLLQVLQVSFAALEMINDQRCGVIHIGTDISFWQSLLPLNQ